VHAPESKRFVLVIRCEPYFRHAATADQFLQVEPTELPWGWWSFRRLITLFTNAKHGIYLS